MDLRVELLFMMISIVLFADVPSDPCNPSPCGKFTKCQVIGGKAMCSCILDYIGDPQVGCRPQCMTNSDCPRDRACINHHCEDPCPGVCGLNAICNVYDHLAICTCPEGLVGNAFIRCIPRREYRIFSLYKFFHKIIVLILLIDNDITFYPLSFHTKNIHENGFSYSVIET